MVVEVLVLGGEESVDDKLWHRLDRQIQPPLLGGFAKQGSIGRMNPRRDRRLMILKLGIIRQVLGKVLDQLRHCGRARDKHDGSGGELEPEKPHHQAHE